MRFKNYNNIYIIIIMENKQAVAVAVGVGAVGTALAYLGYSAYHNKNKLTHIEEPKEEASWLDNLWSNSNNEKSLYNDEEKEDPQLKSALKEEEENIKITAQKKNSAWGKFWKKEHADLKHNVETDEN